MSLITRVSYLQYRIFSCHGSVQGAVSYTHLDVYKRQAIREVDTVSVNFDTGVITDETTGETFQAEPFPPFIQKIIRSGGLMASIQAR